MKLPRIAGEFRVASEPELRFTPAGKAVANLSVVASESRKNEQTGEWEDGDRTPFINVSVWGPAAEAVAGEVMKGERVLVTGDLYARQWEDRDGNKRESVEVKWATVASVPGGKPKGQGGQPAQSRRPADPWAQSNAADPWATPANNEPPF